MVHTYEFEAVDGGTRVRHRVDTKLRGWLNVFRPLVASKGRRDMTKDLARSWNSLWWQSARRPGLRRAPPRRPGHGSPGPPPGFRAMLVRGRLQGMVSRASGRELVRSHARTRG